eukprot:TRINITY_DN14996_c0_g2_i1.p1 TRINITY_DN14996_c0_g2~~TRINITY_DN14996_c0_g2_i1.p1  ORF type:complete len:292 (-),score=44.56 TRINITY_DN14996_c0_g2_i1:39-914(-)
MRKFTVKKYFVLTQFYPVTLQRGSSTLVAMVGKDGKPDFVEYSDKTRLFWDSQLADGGLSWYGKAEKWWVDNCPPTINGVLGGYADLDPTDVKESGELIEEMKKLTGKGGLSMRFERALDGGAGIGRITKHLLSNVFDKIDLVEGNQRLLDSASEFLAEKRSHLGECFCSTLQDFNPEAERYDCMWIQWVVIYLTDADFASFLRRCASALRPGGLIVIKENILSPGEGDLLKDEADSSVSRSTELMRHIFQQADLELLLEKPQVDFPEGMYPVMMYVLRPKLGESPPTPDS